MFRTITALLTSTAAALVVASGLLATASTAAPSLEAHVASSCSVGSGVHVDGYTYLYSIKVSRTSCSTGKNVVKHHGSVRGWHCSTKTLANSPTQVQARETCKSGSKSVVWTYAKNK